MGEKKLGFGLMRLPQIGGEIDIEQTKRMVDMFLERGFTYFDTAWMYMNFKSENAVKEALVDRYPRDSYTLATKLHASFFDSFEDRDKVFNEQLRKTGVEYFDYYLIHDIESGNYDKFKKYDCFNWLRDKKAKGLVKQMGFSFHDTAELLDRVLTENPDMDFVQIQLNYLDWESKKVQSRKCYDVCVKHNKPVVVMEPVKGGTLANVPEKAEEILREMDENMSTASWAVRFAASCEQVFMVLSGMSSIEQMDNNTSYMQDFKPLTEGEIDRLKAVAGIINGNLTVPCTACAYCVDGCPMRIAIPKYFALYNQDMAEKNPGNREKYEELTREYGAASACVGCGQCEGICPQHLKIIDFLKDVTERLETA